MVAVQADKSNCLLLQVMGTQATLCTCGSELLDSLGGEPALRTLFRSGSTTTCIAASMAAFEGDGEEGSSTAGGSVVAHTYREKQYYAVRAGESREESGLAEWAMVGYHGGDLWCLFCPSGRQRGCIHVEMARSGGRRCAEGGCVARCFALSCHTCLIRPAGFALDRQCPTCQPRASSSLPCLSPLHTVQQCSLSHKFGNMASFACP